MRQKFAPAWPDVLGQRAEVIVGRTAAACVHPLVAWRVLPISWRLLVLITYAASSYLVVLGALLAL